MGDRDRAKLLAVAEGLERYAGAQFPGDEVVIARQADLDGPSVDMDRLPRCSPRELADPKCPLVAYDPDEPIRWIRGTDIRDGQQLWVPALMVAYRHAPISRAERFVNSISTGYAVHRSLEESLFGSICEVVERDMIAVAWHQMLPLPRIPFDVLGPLSVDVIKWCREIFVETLLFDATSDVGIPCVYCVQVSPFDADGSTIVGAGTGLTIADAAYSAILEAACIRGMYHSPWKEPENLADFTEMMDGARYMGRASRRHGYDFLVGDSPGRRAFVDRGVYAESVGGALARAVQTFRDLDMPVIAFNRTTSEIEHAGLKATSVLIPDLQPLAFSPVAQYRGHSRLYDAPRSLGYPVRDEASLNPFPQPFG
ncbi:YcaO-like family protein [Oerskovia turbata]